MNEENATLEIEMDGIHYAVLSINADVFGVMVLSLRDFQVAADACNRSHLAFLAGIDALATLGKCACSKRRVMVKEVGATERLRKEKEGK